MLQTFGHGPLTKGPAAFGREEAFRAPASKSDRASSGAQLCRLTARGPELSSVTSVKKRERGVISERRDEEETRNAVRSWGVLPISSGFEALPRNVTGCV